MIPGQTKIRPPAPGRVLVLSNPRSGQGDSGVWKFAELLRERGLSVTEREIGPSPVDGLLHDAGQFSVVVAAGGDGTIGSVAYALRWRDIPLLAYPAGTANLIALNLDLPRDPAELVAVLLAGHTVRLDLGEVEVAGQRSGFCMLAGAGADAAMIKASEDLKERFGPLAYVLAALKQISPRQTRFRLTLDGQSRDFEGIGVMVANLGRAFRLPITRGISPSDGAFSVILLRADHVLRLLPNLIDSVRLQLNLGDPLFSDNVEVVAAREVTVTATEPLPLQYDAELHTETTPFTARVLPGAALFVTGRSGQNLDT